jgi:transcriptional regulator with XRE-family HTH domain
MVDKLSVLAPPQDLARAIKSIRHRLGLSQEKLAQLLDCTQNTISRYEQTTHISSVVRLRKLLDLATEEAEIEAILGQLRNAGAIFLHEFNIGRQPEECNVRG